MPGPGFVHLHLHSEYSLLDACNRLDPLIKRAVDLNMSALAITDHGYMHGAVEFYKKCKAKGIKPIVGVEAYVAPASRRDRIQSQGRAAHLVLLAKDLTGYQNLLKLTTIASLEGFYSRPRIDKEVLAQHSEGIIACSACLGGVVNKHLLAGDEAKATEEAAFYRDLFGPDSFYLELQDHGLPEQAPCNEKLVRMARELGIPLVATNDAHYLSREDAFAHEVLLCIGTQTNIEDPKHRKYHGDNFFVKSAEEMYAALPLYPEAVERSLEIAERCNLELVFDRTVMPTPEMPEGRTAGEYLREFAMTELLKRIPNPPDHYLARMEHEFSVIEQTGFPQYVLIVADFAQFARKRGIYFGVRGSAAGSLVSYAVGITDIDPIEYGLTFERWLNPERKSMPDIDMDFEDTRRGEVIQYVADRYGTEHVAQIATFGTLAAKAVIKDTGRALAMPLADVNRYAAMIPSQLHISIDESLEKSDELRTAYTRDPAVRRLLDTARRLEGVSRNASIHAAGIVIAADPLVELTPLTATGENNGLVSQYPAASLESAGLLKMDFLGLINLSILGKAVGLIEQTTGVKLDIRKLPLDDQKSYDLLGRGDTTGVFQLESDGMRKAITQLRPTSVRDLAAMVALYRPGPMESIPAFVKAKNSQDPIQYIDPRMEEILSETYGVLVYQDQVLQTARVIAGYSLGAADNFRRAMGKKKAEVMEAEKSRFLDGAVAGGCTRQLAGEIFSLIEPFAGYGFNKAHAVCYAMVAYQTAYLKANYTVEYMAALLSCFMDKPDKMVVALEECNRLGVAVRGPDINASQLDFTVEDGAIRFGLAAIKNVGKAAVQAIITNREEEGPFASLDDFCTRAPAGVNKSAAEALILTGAFDSVVPNRRALVDMLPTAIRNGQQAQKDRQSGQVSLFADATSSTHQTTTPVPNVPDLTMDRRLAFEKELLGCYLSGHPLHRYRERLNRRVSTRIAEIGEVEDRAEVTVGGLVSNARHTTTRRTNAPMAYLTLEDPTGQISVTILPRAYDACKDAATNDAVVVMKCTVQRREDDDSERGTELLANEAVVLGTLSAAAGATEMLHVRLDPRNLAHIGLLRGVLEQHRGQSPVYMHVPYGREEKVIRTDIKVEPTGELKDQIGRMLGRNAAWVE